MNLSRKRIKHLLLHKNKIQSKKKYIKKNKKKNTNTFRKRKKKNLRTSSMKFLKKRKVSKYKRKSYLKGGGGRQEYLNTFLQVLKRQEFTEESSLENNKHYNFDFIFNKNANMQEIMTPDTLQQEFNITAKTDEEKKEDEEAAEIKEIEEKEDAERKVREEFINEEAEKFIENSKTADNSVIYVYNGDAGPAIAVQNSENQVDNWFKSISNVLSTI
jgi:hypothetical protein